MTPRTYKLGTRANSAAATRERIVESAAALYRERRVSGTTIQAVAERADVARGTVLNHFGSADGLLEAVLDRAVEELEYPDPAVIEAATTDDERIRRYVDEIFRFFDRGRDWWQVFYADLEMPALQARERHYYDVLGRLHLAAFGALAKDRLVGAAAKAYLDYGPMYALLEAGLTLDEAIDVVATALIAVTRTRRAAGSATERKEG